MTQIKFCGIRRDEDVDYVNQVRPDYVGFVFWTGSRRYVDPSTAMRLAGRLTPGIKKVGVFLDAEPGEIEAIARSGCIDMVQLHGHESEGYIASVKEMTGLPVIKAFTVRDRADLERAEACSADHLMLDSGAGTGSVFDWSLLKGFGRDYFLAGGLNPGNVGKAVTELDPMTVDTSSGIETEGTKDLSKMIEFKNAVIRTAGNRLQNDEESI